MARGKKVGSIYTEIRARLDKLDRDYSTAHTKSKTAARKIQRSIDKISFKKASDSYRRFQRLFAVGLAGYGIKTLATAALDVASSFEMMQIKLDSLTRGRGKETLDELNAWALEMPVNTRKAVDTFVMMQAMGLDPTIAKMQTLVDVSSIFGQEAMPRVARALGQMATLGRLSAEELNQMSEAGINARKYLTEAFGMTVEELQKSQISIERIIDAIWKGLDADFAGAAQKAQSSWQGMVVTFKSYMEEMARQVMDAGVFDELKTQLDDINTRLKAWLETNRELIKATVPAYIAKIKGALEKLWSILTYDPAIIEYGLFGLLIWGKKGAALLGGVAHLGKVVQVQAKAFQAMADGQLSFSQVATANYTELTALVDGLGTGLKKLGDSAELVEVRRRIAMIKDEMATIASSNAPGKERMLGGLNHALNMARNQMYSLRQTWDETTRYMSTAAEKVGKILPSETAVTSPATTVPVSAEIKTDYTDFWQRQADERYRVQSRMYDALIEQEKAYVQAGKEIGKDMWLVKAEDMQRIADQAQDAGSTIKDTFEDSFSAAGYSMTNMLMDGELSFKKFADSVIGDLFRIGTQKAFSAIGTSLMAGLFAAKGAAFDAAGVTPFARGGIVSRPTRFAFAGGAGLMGEAGPEAVLPLARTPGGELGVQTAGQARPINLVVNIAAPEGRIDRPSLNRLTTETGMMLQRAMRRNG